MFVCPILMALGCYRNGYKSGDCIVVEVVDSPHIIERAIVHEVGNEIDVKRWATTSSLHMYRALGIGVKGQALERWVVLRARGHSCFSFHNVDI